MSYREVFGETRNWANPIWKSEAHTHTSTTLATSVGCCCFSDSSIIHHLTTTSSLPSLSPSLPSLSFSFSPLSLSHYPPVLCGEGGRTGSVEALATSSMDQICSHWQQVGRGAVHSVSTENGVSFFYTFFFSFFFFSSFCSSSFFCSTLSPHMRLMQISVCMYNAVNFASNKLFIISPNVKTLYKETPEMRTHIFLPQEQQLKSWNLLHFLRSHWCVHVQGVPFHYKDQLYNTSI